MLLKFYHQSHIWKSSGSRVIDQNAVNQSNCMIPSNNMSRKKWIKKFIFDMQIKVQVFYKLITSTPNKKFVSLCNICRKMWGMKLIFCLQINMEVFYKLILSFWICVARYAQSTQNYNFAIFFQYLKGKVKDKVDFLPAVKH